MAASTPDFWIPRGDGKLAVEAKTVFQRIFPQEYDILRGNLLCIDCSKIGYGVRIQHIAQTKGRALSPSKSWLQSELCRIAAHGPGEYELTDPQSGWVIGVLFEEAKGSGGYVGSSCTEIRDVPSDRVRSAIKKAVRQHEKLGAKIIPAISLFESSSRFETEFSNAILKRDWSESVDGVIAFGSSCLFAVQDSTRPNLTLWCRPGRSAEDILPGWVFDVVIEDEKTGEPLRQTGRHYIELLRQ